METFRFLENGEEIKQGDEFQRPDSSWELIDRETMMRWYKTTGKRLFHDSAVPVRRKLYSESAGDNRSRTPR